MKRWVGPVITACMMLVACGDQHSDAAKKLVLSKLTDPSSAQFDKVTVFPGDIVCGTVNSKNKFGGYVGPRVFVYNGDKRGEVVLDADQGTIDFWCKEDNSWGRFAEFESMCNAEPATKDAATLKEHEEMCKKVAEMRRTSFAK